MKTEYIHIGNVSMPLQDFVVSRNAILGITKSGKTYTAKGVAEQLLDYEVPIIVFDAIGVWRYLKTPGDQSNSKGYKVVVAGGEHPDLPLNPQSAPEIVRAAIKENIPLIIDLYDSKLSKADWRRIVQACFRVLLYENKGLRHVFLEEAAEFAPQKVSDGETYAEVEKLARMGGNKGVGITFINQRAQELNKAVLELCDNVVLLRQRGSHAIDSLEKWMDRLAPDAAREISSTMPQMTQGDCWIFTENDEVPVRTRSGIIKSLHPDRRMPEQALSQRKSVDSEIFVKRLTTELPRLAEEKKENDPVLLKKKIAELERQLKTPAKTGVEYRDIPVFTKGDLASLHRVEKKCADISLAIERAMSQMRVVENIIVKLKPKPTELLPRNPISTAFLENHQRVNPILHVRKPAPEKQATSNGTLPVGEEKILSACIQFRNGVSRSQLTVLTGYKRSSRDAYISRLKEKRLVDQNGEMIFATLEGEEALPNAKPLPTGDELQRYWLERLPEGERKIFEIVLARYPEPMQREHIDEATGYKRSSRDAYLSRMSAKMIITEPARGLVRASDQLFQ